MHNQLCVNGWQNRVAERKQKENNLLRPRKDRKMWRHIDMIASVLKGHETPKKKIIRFPKYLRHLNFFNDDVFVKYL